MSADRPLVGRKRVAHELDVSPATASRWKAEGRLKVVQLGGAKSPWRVERKELDRLRGEREG